MEQPPFNIDPRLKEYLARHFKMVDNKIENAIQLDILTAVPPKPSIGKLYYFSQAVGAITSIGYWGYTNAGWVKLG